MRADVIIIPVRNRCAITLGCLRTLAADGVLDWATVLVMDDGSTDGTGEAIRRDFPLVELQRGDGTWWWAGAIRRGMAWALQNGAERIYWLNDDCRPPAGGMAALRDQVTAGGGVAWIDAQAAGGWTYGAHRKTLGRIRRCTPAEEARDEIDTFSGNCVALPRAWIERVGLPDAAAFPHGLADLDYGLRLKQAGARLRPLQGYVAENAEPPARSAERWLTSPRDMRAIWREFSSPRSFLYFPAWRRFALRHWGPLWGWLVFAKPYVEWCLIALVRRIAPGWVRAQTRRHTTM